MMRYLQSDALKKLDLYYFDNWAAMFTEQKIDYELAPEGTGYRLKTRLANYVNLPELLNLWKQCADIQTEDMLPYIEKPKAEYIDIVTKPTEEQQTMVQNLAERAEMVRRKKVDRDSDNMLLITNDGRKLALDQRIIDASLPDTSNTKVNTCIKTIMENWRLSADILGTQLIFCDLSTPTGKSHKGKTEICIYDDIKEKLIKKGIPEKEIAYIHDANTDAKKEALFEKVRQGKVRVLLGSSKKMGAGVNVQSKIVALHHLDTPWRPADLAQREGRALRQGNENSSVKIYRYVTEGTFDAYSWAILEKKQRFISQILTSKSPARTCEDMDGTELSYAQVKALAAGDSKLKDVMDLELSIRKLKMQESSFYIQKYTMEDNLTKHYPKKIQSLNENLTLCQKDNEIRKMNDLQDFKIEIDNQIYTERKTAGEAILSIGQNTAFTEQEKIIGNYCGFSLYIDKIHNSFFLKNNKKYTVEIGSDAVGNTIRLSNALKEIPKEISRLTEAIVNLQKAISYAQEEVKKTWPYESDLAEKNTRLAALRKELEQENSTQENSLQKTEAGKPHQEKTTSKPNEGEKTSLLAKLSVNQEIVKQTLVSSPSLIKKEAFL